MYKITIKDINTNEVFEYEINNIMEIKEILLKFYNKTIELELHRIDKKLTRSK